MPTADDLPTTLPPLINARGLVVSYPGVRALDGVDFGLAAGEVHALLGENGAGKSTLINVLSGLVNPTAGSIEVGGSQRRLNSPRTAEAAGISTVHQEVDLIPTLSIAENICLGRLPQRFGLINWRAARRRATAALGRVGINLDPRRVLGECSIAEQQLVAIARAMDVRCRVLILDEPTSSLDAAEASHLLQTLRKLRRQGLGIILITHFLDQVYAVADRITVLRNGRRIGTWTAADLPHARLVEAMTGRELSHLRSSIARDGALDRGQPLLTVEGLGRAPSIEPVSTSIARAESVGIAGLLGSGRSELARLIFGADIPDSGSVSMQGTQLRRGSVRHAISRGLAMTPEDRKIQGLIVDLSVRQNIILALQARRGALRPVRASEQRRLADHYIQSLRIKAPSAESPVCSLSGGNQQKVLLARWLAIQPKLLILDEPTRGIDVGARAEIESLIASLCTQGMSIILISAEVDELVRVCSRILVMRDRRCIGELEGDKLTESSILQHIAAGTARGEVIPS